MSAKIRRPFRAAAIVLAGMGAMSALPLSPALAQADFQTRLQRLERDMRDLEAEAYRRGVRDVPPGQPPAAQATPDLDPLMRRLDELQEGMRRLTGQMEELGHRVDLLNERADRMQRDIDYQAKQTATAAPLDGEPEAAAPDQFASARPPDAGGPVLRPYAPRPGVLGQIPAGSPLPKPAAQSSDPKQDFDQAMNLLSRAQYDQAASAFRGFLDAHPDDARASQALYWSGDIAFSAKKDYAQAARDFAELLKKYPKTTRAPEGMLKLGLSLFQLHQVKEGCAALAALPVKYPDAPAAITTRARNERRDNKCT